MHAGLVQRHPAQHMQACMQVTSRLASPGVVNPHVGSDGVHDHELEGLVGHQCCQRVQQLCAQHVSAC